MATQPSVAVIDERYSLTFSDADCMRACVCSRVDVFLRCRVRAWTSCVRCHVRAFARGCLPTMPHASVAVLRSFSRACVLRSHVDVFLRCRVRAWPSCVRSHVHACCVRMWTSFYDAACVRGCLVFVLTCMRAAFVRACVRGRLACVHGRLHAYVSSIQSDVSSITINSTFIRSDIPTQILTNKVLGPRL